MPPRLIRLGGLPMVQVVPGRFTAKMDEPFVVFVIGMRINRPLALRKWLPTARAMPPMLKELYKHPEKGFLGAEFFLYRWGPAIVQYWRSFEDLERFAPNPRHPPPPAPRRGRPRRRVLPRPRGARDRAVLALLRGPREVRPQPRRPAPASLAALQQKRGQGRERGHLPRDLHSGARELRGGLLQHAGLRFGQGHGARPRGGRARGGEA